MSRIHDALKKAEQDRAAGLHSPAEVGTMVEPTKNPASVPKEEDGSELVASLRLPLSTLQGGNGDNARELGFHLPIRSLEARPAVLAFRRPGVPSDWYGRVPDPANAPRSDAGKTPAANDPGDERAAF